MKKSSRTRVSSERARRSVLSAKAERRRGATAFVREHPFASGVLKTARSPQSGDPDGSETMRAPYRAFGFLQGQENVVSVDFSPLEEDQPGGMGAIPLRGRSGRLEQGGPGERGRTFAGLRGTMRPGARPRVPAGIRPWAVGFRLSGPHRVSRSLGGGTCGRTCRWLWAVAGSSPRTRSGP